MAFALGRMKQMCRLVMVSSSTNSGCLLERVGSIKGYQSASPGLAHAKSIVCRQKSNGRAERAVKCIINALRLYLVFRKLNWVYALPFALWGLNDLRGAIVSYSPQQLVFGRDPFRIGEVAPHTVGGGLVGATDYFRRPQDQSQLIQTKLANFHVREYQAFLKKHPSLQFQGGDRVWVQNRTDQPGLHPRLDKVWHGPAEIFHKVSTNT